MSINSDYSKKRDKVFDLPNDAKEVLESLHKGIEERRLIAFPTVDNTEDTHLLSSPDDQLHVLKTHPILDPDQDYISMTDEQRNAIFIQNLNFAQDSINVMEDNAKDDYYHILVAGNTNSGKSAFINGLLRRKILPSEGRALTSAFVEILDARDINGKEEVHLCKKGVDYDCKNEDTFVQKDVTNLCGIMNDWYNKKYNTMYDAIKVYIDHRRVHTNFLGNSERKVHIIESVDGGADDDEIHSLFKKHRIDVVIFIVNAKSRLTKSSRNIMKNYCREKKQIFVVITHLDRVCRCRGKCRRSCKEVCKQRIMGAIKAISPETVASASELIHCVNPTSAPLWDGKPNNAVGEILSEWTYMEVCLRTFIYDQLDFYKLSPIKNYPQKPTYDVTLSTQLNESTLTSKTDKKNGEISQPRDGIGQLEDRHNQACTEAEMKINVTTNEIYNYILQRLNDIKEHPKKSVNGEMTKRTNSRVSKAELRMLLQKR